MYDPKGGNKPAYEPPYQKPPVEEPPQENPPEYPSGEKPPTEKPPYGQQPPPEQPPYEQKPPTGEEPPYGKKPPGNGKTCDPPTGNCKCPDWELENGPANEPFRRLLQRLEDILEGLAEKPTDATKKFADDLKDADKEYQGVVALVNKYKEFYDKLDCKMAEAINWREDMAEWIAGKLTEAEKNAIQQSHQTNYGDVEKRICCEWIKCREYFLSMQDCLEQAKKKEEEAKENYDAIKNLEKTLGDRFADLKSLFDKAKGYRDEERFRAVYAVSLEYEAVFKDLSLIRDWFNARTECNVDSEQTQSAPDTAGNNDPRKVWTPQNFKTELVRRLRLLILARYQKLRWWHDFLTRTSDNQKKKEACEKFRKERRDKFIQEADDIEPEETGEGEGGGYPGGGETPKYPGGETPKYPGGGETPKYPGGGGETPQYPPQTPPQQPPTQQYPGKEYPPPQTPPTQYPGAETPEYPPPTQQYPGGKQPQYPQTPPPPQSRGRKS